MNGETLLCSLRQRGVLLRAEGERLHVEAPAGFLSPDLRNALAEHKSDLLALLRSQIKGRGGDDQLAALRAQRDAAASELDSVGDEVARLRAMLGEGSSEEERERRSPGYALRSARWLQLLAGYEATCDAVDCAELTAQIREEATTLEARREINGQL